MDQANPADQEDPVVPVDLAVPVYPADQGDPADQAVRADMADMANTVSTVDTVDNRDYPHRMAFWVFGTTTYRSPRIEYLIQCIQQQRHVDQD
ncbi:MAG TPA: hypothetical protein PK003_05935 [Bacillota bacterium]|nr:hypothetical protein [Bacillota bacterium]